MSGHSSTWASKPEPCCDNYDEHKHGGGGGCVVVLIAFVSAVAAVGSLIGGWPL